MVKLDSYYLNCLLGIWQMDRKPFSRNGTSTYFSALSLFHFKQGEHT